VAEANEHVLVVPIVESVTAAQNIQELVAVPGVELFFFGPADFSSTAGFAGQWEGPGVAEMILEAKDAIRSAGKNCGLLTTSNANLLEREQQGFRMLGLGVDCGLLLRSLEDALATVGQSRKMKTDLSVADNS
jgi:2-keto-3-deoxy-L-rhamnonate aldolase RhmA